MSIGPLAGIRVVEAGRFASAPSCGTVLADWGAEVIKLEPPGGDPARGPGSLEGGQGLNPRFDVHNRSRRSVVLDLATKDGHRHGTQLVGSADVFVTNLRPAALTRLGIDEPTLRTAFPRLVYAQVTGYGLGEAENIRSYDHGAFWAYSGMAALFGDSEGAPPQPAGGMGDRASGTALAGAVAAALFARERTGRGDHVTVSLLRTAIWLMASDAADALHRPDRPRELSRAAAPIPTVNCFRCLDGRWIWLQSMLPELDWDVLLEALDAHWLDDDPRFRGGQQCRVQQARSALVEALDEIFRRRTAEEWVGRLRAAGLTVAAVRTLAEAVSDPVVLASGAIRDARHGETVYPTVNSPCSFGDGLADARPAPAPGADTDEVLAELSLDGPVLTTPVLDGGPAGPVTA